MPVSLVTRGAAADLRDRLQAVRAQLEAAASSALAGSVEAAAADLRSDTPDDGVTVRRESAAVSLTLDDPAARDREFGTAASPARPRLRPAVARAAGEAREGVAAAARSAIERKP